MARWSIRSAHFSAQSLQLSGFAIAVALAASGIGEVAIATTRRGQRSAPVRAFVELVGPSISIGDLAAGDTTEHSTELVNHTGRPVDVVKLAVLNDVPSRLTLDTAHGLRIGVDRCDEPWTTNTTNVACPSRAAAIVVDQPIGNLADQAIIPIRLPSGGRAHLRIRVALPASAGNDLMGQSASIRVAFTVTG